MTAEQLQPSLQLAGSSKHVDEQQKGVANREDTANHYRIIIVQVHALFPASSSPTLAAHRSGDGEGVLPSSRSLRVLPHVLCRMNQSGCMHKLDFPACAASQGYAAQP